MVDFAEEKSNAQRMHAQGREIVRMGKAVLESIVRAEEAEADAVTLSDAVTRSEEVSKDSPTPVNRGRLEEARARALSAHTYASECAEAVSKVIETEQANALAMANILTDPTAPTEKKKRR